MRVPRQLLIMAGGASVGGMFISSLHNAWGMFAFWAVLGLYVLIARPDTER